MIMPDGPVHAVVDAAVHAEAVGCERVWIPDEGISGRECWVTLAAVAAATRRIQLGTGITNAYTRHPGVTAAAVATLDELSGGRAMLGIGAGGGLTLGPLAIERRAPLTAMRELATTSRALWEGQTVHATGVGGSFHHATLDYGRADIPIWFAGRGPRVMELGGRFGDGFILSYLHRDLIGDHVKAIRDASAEAGRPVPRLAYMTMIATDDDAHEAARAALTFRLVDSPDAVRERLGLDEDTRSAMRRAIAEGGLEAAAPFVRDEWIHRFVITGGRAECASQLERILDEHDIDEFQASVPHPGEAIAILDTVAGLLT